MSDTLLDKNKIWQQIDDEKENMLQLWQELVNVDCGSGNKAGVDFIAQKIEAILKTLGFATTQVEFEKAGNTLVGKIGDTSKDFIVLLGHMDTVFKDGTVAERPFKIVDGKAYGPGCLDMKGGIVIMLTALKVLLANNYSKHGIKVILAGDEEVAHYLSNASENNFWRKARVLWQHLTLKPVSWIRVLSPDARADMNLPWKPMVAAHT